MPLLDPLHQLQQAGRTNGTTKTYVTTLVTDKGTAAVSGTPTDTITFTNLEVELDGNRIKATKALDLGNISSLLTAGKEYIICAVASYTEPANQSAAEAAGLDYYVIQNANGEAVAYRFFPSNILAAINAAGGIAKAKQAMFFDATSADAAAYQTYYEQLERLQDPKYVTKALLPTGFELVVGELEYQDNTATDNIFPSKTRSQFRLLKSQLGELSTKRRILTGAEAATAFGSKPWLVKTAKSYASLVNAQTDASGTDVTAAVVAADVALTTYSFSAAYYVIQEYILPGTTDIGQTFKGYTVTKWFDKQSSSLLGRLNPIYLDSTSLLGTVRLPQREAKRLTQYAYPCELAKVTWSGTAISATTYIYDTGL